MEQSEIINLNLNAAECIQSVDHWRETVYYNICAGTQQVVPWGIGQFLGCMAAVVMIGVLGALFILVIKELRRY